MNTPIIADSKHDLRAGQFIANRTVSGEWQLTTVGAPDLWTPADFERGVVILDQPKPDYVIPRAMVDALRVEHLKIPPGTLLTPIERIIRDLIAMATEVKS